MYDVARYAEAVEELKQAYALSGAAALLYDIAQAYKAADDPAQAIRFYRRYLERSGHPRNEAEVQAKIAELQALITSRLAPASDPEAGAAPPPSAGVGDAAAVSAGDPLALRPDVDVGCGQSSSEAPGAESTAPASCEAPGASPGAGSPSPSTDSTPVAAAPPETAQLESPRAIADPAPAGRECARSAQRRQTAGVVLAIGGGVSLASSFTLAILASRTEASVEAAAGDGRYDAAADARGQKLNTASVVTAVVGAALVAGGGVLWLLGRCDEGGQPRSAALTPLLLPDAAGLAAAVSF